MDVQQTQVRVNGHRDKRRLDVQRTEDKRLLDRLDVQRTEDKRLLDVQQTQVRVYLTALDTQ